MKEKIRTLIIHCHLHTQVVHQVQNSDFTVELSKLERKNNTADKTITKEKKKIHQAVVEKITSFMSW